MLEKLTFLKNNIEKSATQSGRKVEEISILAVTKNASLSQIKEAFDLGLRDFGENRVQDALEKMEKLPKEIRWHFIGRLQKNKVNKILGKFFLIHSVDSVELCEKISLCGFERGIDTSILLQANTSLENTKAGLTVEEWEERFCEVKRLPNIVVKGLMTMAPLTLDKEKIHASFKKLANLKNSLEKEGDMLPILSMGMSSDYQIAIEEGATLLRIGSGLFQKEYSRLNFK